MKQLALSLLFSLLALTGAQARHILGGYMTYRHVGDSVLVKMVIYRDCLGGGAPFDNPASIAVYRDGVLFQEVMVTALAIENITPLPSDFPCDATNIPAICAERGTYSFALYLPPSDATGTYDVVYQRCCRNNSTNNLIDPGGSGHTLTVSITPAARLSKNSSPTFSDAPPQLFACLHQPNVFDLSATDAEGDTLLYTFCNPLLGGGPILTPPGVFACEGAVPTPPCPPPFDLVVFVAPTYSFVNPFGPGGLTLNGLTGAMEFTPQTLGTFAYAVCVEEYRNGQLLSRVQRELVMIPLDGISPTTEPAALHELSLRPNPASSSINLDLIDFEGQTVEIPIADAMGRVVFSQKKQAILTENLSVESLAPEAYSVRVEADGRVAQGRFVRQ